MVVAAVFTGTLADARRAVAVLLGTIVAVVGVGMGFPDTATLGLELGPVPGLFVGLAARNGSDRSDDIERLTDELRQFVSRLDGDAPASFADDPDTADSANSIDFIIDRDDEIGRLSEAVDELAATVRDRERRRAESERYRQELYRITSDPDLRGEAKIRRLLELGRDRLGVETGLVSRIDESADRYEIETAVGRESDLEGTELDLSTIYCRDAIESDDVLGIYDAAATGWEAHPAAERGLSCYIGAKIVVDDELYGTVCFLDRDPRDRPFTPAEKSFVDLLSRWISQSFERRRYVRTIRERERRLEQARAFTDDMLDAVDDVVYLLDEDGEIQRWNESLCAVTGYSDDEIAGMHAAEFFDESDREFISDAIADSISMTDTRTEAALRTKSGERIPYEFVASPLEDPSGETVLAGVGRDISDRKEKERRLERHEVFMNDVLDALDDVFYILEENGDLRRWNETLVEVSGYSDAEIESMDALEFFDEANRAVIRDSIVEAFETGDTHVEAELETKSGEQIPYEFIASVLEDPDGKPVEVGIGRDISDRKETERRLREREARLERTTHMLEQSQRLANVGAWELDVSEEPYKPRWTAEVHRIHGLSPDEEIDLDQALEFYHPEDRSLIEEAVERAIEDGEPYDLEVRLLTDEGELQWVRTIGESVEENGEVVKLRGSFQDITERKERERELERSETIIQALDELVYTIDTDGRFTFLNDALTSITGHEPDELIGEHVSTVMAEGDLETARDRVRDLLRAGAPSQTFEMDLETVDGDVIDAENHMALLPMPEGEFAGTAGVIRDITERKERERDLERFETIVQALDELVYTLDEAGRFTFLNDAVTPILGYEPDELLGEPAATVIPSDDVERAQATIRELLRSEEPSRTTEIVLETVDGDEIDVENHIALLPMADDEFAGSAGVIRDITERKERERELERTTELLKQAERLAGIGGWELDVSTEPNAVSLTDGLRRLYDLPLDADVGPRLASSFPHPDDRQAVLETVDAALEDGESYEIEHRMRTAEGDERWVRSIGEPVREAGHRSDGSPPSADIVGVRGTIQDITEHKERELALESLHSAARDLLGSETHEEVAELVVDTAAEILEASGVAVYRLDSDVNRLEPVAYTDGFATLCDGPPSVAVGDGDSVLWNAYVTGTGTVVDDPASFDRSQVFGPTVESGIVVPIGDHGVFAVASGEKPIDADARRLIETLVATTEAAFDRLESEASLREREAELEERNRRLNRQIESTELIRRIDQLLIGADSREEIERTVPERLLEAENIAFAWIGTLDASGTRLEPRTWAGQRQAYLDDASLAYDASTEPAVRTARSETTTVVSNVVEGLQSEGWRRHALDCGFQSVISVPLSYAEYTYGVLTVYADEPDAFGDLERTVITELGEGIANAITAVKTREALHAERLLELTLRIEDADDLLSRIATATGARVEYEGLGSHSGDETLLFFETSGVPADDVRTVLEDLVSVTEYRLLSETDGTCRFEATVAGDVVASRLVRHGASPRSMHATGDGMEVTVDVPTGTDVREFVETLREQYATVELKARRHVERSMGTRSELVTSLFDVLTDRQLEVLRTAYFAGFFDWPRESTGEEIAAMLGVTQPTVNRHLRIGQQRLLAQLFEDELPSTAG
ncbi:PAS domain S-box protein [Natrinema amylolyticum]|uniref:PAS domain S-box protein n=1 Tax=Natrinema amylolyticum TaxID=2878679 RepID=UPI001CF93B25|nr:PAS domain S-box protein [Natrinema amylolyticum]